MDQSMKKIVYRLRQEDYLHIFTHNERMIQEFCANGNIEKTNGRGVVAYLMRYAFKPPNTTLVEV